MSYLLWSTPDLSQARLQLLVGKLGNVARVLSASSHSETTNINESLQTPYPNSSLLLLVCQDHSTSWLHRGISALDTLKSSLWNLTFTNSFGIARPATTSQLHLTKLEIKSTP